MFFCHLFLLLFHAFPVLSSVNWPGDSYALENRQDSVGGAGTALPPSSFNDSPLLTQAQLDPNNLSELFDEYFFSNTQGARVESPVGVSALFTLVASLLATDLAQLASPNVRSLASSSFLDLSPVYGDTVSQIAAARQGRYLTIPPPGATRASAFGAAMATLFALEHNARVDLLASGTVLTWQGEVMAQELLDDDDVLFAEGRAWTIGLWQALVTKDWLTAATGTALPRYTRNGTFSEAIQPVASGTFALLVLPLLVSMSAPPSISLGDGERSTAVCLRPPGAAGHPCLPNGSIAPLILGALDTTTLTAAGLSLPLAQYGYDDPWPDGLPVALQLTSLARRASLRSTVSPGTGDALVDLLANSSTIRPDGSTVGFGQVAPALEVVLREDLARIRAGDARWFERTASDAMLDELRHESFGLLLQRHLLDGESTATVSQHPLYRQRDDTDEADEVGAPPAMPDGLTGLVTLSPSLRLGWSVDDGRSTIRLVLQAVADGYVGLGIGGVRSGDDKVVGKVGSDVIMCSEVSPSGVRTPGVIGCIDTYVDEDNVPRPDSMQAAANDDLTEVSVTVAGGWTTVDVRRPLDAADGAPVDQAVLLDGPTTVFVATSGSHEWLYHGPFRSLRTSIDFSSAGELEESPSRDTGLGTGAMVGIVVGVSLCLLFLVLAAAYRVTSDARQRKEVELSLRAESIAVGMELQHLNNTEAQQIFKLPVLSAESTSVRDAPRKPARSWPLKVSKTKFDFGVHTVLVPVGQIVEDTVIVTNTCSKRVNIGVFEEDFDDSMLPKNAPSGDVMANQSMLSHGGRYLATATPKTASLGPGKSVEIRVRIKLLCTTRINSFIGIALDPASAVVTGQAVLMHDAVAFDLESEVSPFLDFTELVLEEKIGIGSFGLVFAGRWRRQKVAIKVLLQQEYMQDWQYQEFEKEVNLLEQLRHKNIVRFVGACMQPSRLSMVTELCAIGSLKHVLAEFALPWDMTIRVCLDTAVGLLFLHDTGLLHQDIKPGNVLVSALSAEASVVAKLTDFGSTGRVVNKTSGRFTLAGTPVYLAPEMDGRRAPTQAADVYSWAITAYEVVTQSDPFPDIDLAWSIAGHVRAGNRPVFPDDVLEQAPPALVSVIRAAWATDPDDRPNLGSIIPEVVKSFKELKLDELHETWAAETSATTKRLELDLARLGTDAAYREQGLPRSSAGDGSTSGTGSGSLGAPAGSPNASMSKPTTGRVLRRGVTGLFGPSDSAADRSKHDAPLAAVSGAGKSTRSPPVSPRSPRSSSMAGSPGRRRRTPPRRATAGVPKRRSNSRSNSAASARSRSRSRPGSLRTSQRTSRSGSQEFHLLSVTEDEMGFRTIVPAGSQRESPGPGSPVRGSSGRMAVPPKRLRARARSFELELELDNGSPFGGLPTMLSEDESVAKPSKAARSVKTPAPAVPSDPGSGLLPRSLSTLNRRIARSGAMPVAQADADEAMDMMPEGLPRSTPSTFQVSERCMTGAPTLRRHAQVIDPEQAELLVRVAGSTVCLVRATIDHYAKSSAELTFFVGEAFSASPTKKDGTWRGIHKGKTGLFPFHKVELVQDAAVENAKDRAKSRRAKSRK